MMSPTSLMAVGVTITDMVDSFGCGSVGLEWFGAVEDSVLSEPIGVSSGDGGRPRPRDRSFSSSR